MVAAVVVLGGAALVGKGLIGSEGAAATFLAGSTAAASPTGPSPEELAKIERAKRVKALDAALKKYAGTVPGFAVAVLDKKTGDLYAFRGDQQFRTASVVKVQVLACLLLTAQDAGRKLTADEDAKAKLMIRNSDNAATTALFTELGKQSAIQACDKRLGLRHTVVNSAWGLTQTTVTDQVKLLSQLVAADSPIKARGRAYAHTLMSTVNPAQRWGVPAAARAGEEFTVKNGWLPRMSTSDLWIVNSVGRITGDDVDVSIAVLSHGHQSQEAGEAVIEKAVKLTRSHLKY
nr:serine hydrolase [Actinoplanes ianthinogenes]